MRVIPNSCMPTLDLLESMALAKKHGVKFAPFAVAKKEGELANACKKIGFPLVLKLVSSKVSHKTEVKGVVLNVRDEAAAAKEFKRLRKLPGFKGVVVQPMVKGVELIVGGKNDAQFGPTVLFGLGGVFVEIYKDTSLRICPITGRDAEEMLDEIKAAGLLKGYRGSKPVNRKKLVELLLNACKLMAKEKIQELDLNPVIANDQEVLAVDARVVR